MNKDKSVPRELINTACLSGGLTILLTLSSIVLCILALVYRYDCAAGAVPDGAKYFIITILKTYILEDSCVNALPQDDLTKSHVVFILTIIILVFAVIGLATAIALLAVVNRDEAVKSLDILTYVYVGVCVASLVVDLTLGVHFGMDYQTLKNNLASFPPGSALGYETDMIRLGAFFLMTLSLKGFIGHAINIVLLILLTCQVITYQQNVNRNEHSIHKMGALNAFDTPKRLEDPWSRSENFFVNQRVSHLNHHNDIEPHHIPIRDTHSSYESSMPQKRLEDPWNPHRDTILPRGPKSNPAFINDVEPPRSALRDNHNSDLNRPVNRSDSWLHNQINAAPGLGSRPFSYLEEPKPRPVPVKSSNTPNHEPNWRRDPWPPAPPVPDPDYSPQPRRLKSALKSNYP